jgi:hypothetical protein
MTKTHGASSKEHEIESKPAVAPKKTASTIRLLTRQELETLRQRLQKKFHRS